MRYAGTFFFLLVWLGAISCSTSQPNTSSAEQSDKPLVSTSLSHDIAVGDVGPFSNEPDNFRGVRWGTLRGTLHDLKPFDLPELSKGLFGTQLALKSSEDPYIGKIKVSSILYLFRDEKFAGVLILFPGASWEEMKDQLYLRYGNPISVPGSSDKDGFFTWMGPTGTVMLSKKTEVSEIRIWSTQYEKWLEASAIQQMNKGF